MSYSISRVNWQQAAPLLKDIRERVFVCERRIPKKVEFDRQDANAFHMLVCDDFTQEPVATGRLLPSGELGRIAVVMDHRKKKIDKLVIKGLISIAKEIDIDEVFINSPLDSISYFSKRHFYSVGTVFMEAGRPKQRMACLVNEVTYNKFYLGH